MQGQTRLSDKKVDEIIQEIEIGLKPIIDNSHPESMSKADREDILEDLEQLRQLALKAKI
ncbi:MAG: hypothetical protein AB8G22_01450 [Saprospiraceae bacterium]